MVGACHPSIRSRARPSASPQHREPAFVLPGPGGGGAAEARRVHRRARAGGPNILVILMDDVGWGDFGCYGGGVAVGAPTPNIDRLARARPAAHVVLLRAVVHAVAGDADDRPPADAPRPAPAADVRRAGRPAGRGHARRSCCRDAGYVTQAVGKWHMGENVESQPQNVGFDDFYGFLSVSDMYTRVARPVLLPRDRLQRGAHGVGARTMPFNKCFVHATRGGEAENVEEVTIPVLSLLDDKWCDYSERLHPAHGRLGDAAVVPLPLHARRPLRQLPARALPRRVAGASTPTRTRSSSSTTSSGGSCASSRRPASSRTR